MPKFQKLKGNPKIEEYCIKIEDAFCVFWFEKNRFGMMAFIHLLKID